MLGSGLAHLPPFQLLIRRNKRCHVSAVAPPDTFLFGLNKPYATKKTLV